MTTISLHDLHRLLADAVIQSIHRDGCDVYLALSKAGRVPTAAAAVQQCPRCGGPLAHDGVVVACRRRIACGWVELVSRAVRAGGAS